MPLKTNDELKAYHATYCRLTGYDLPWDTGRRFHWETFALHVPLEDLAILIRYIQRRQRMKLSARSLLFRNLIGCPPISAEYALEDIRDAKLEMRQKQSRVEPGKADVFKATGRDTSITSETRTAGDVLARTKAYELFREQMREQGLL